MSKGQAFVYVSFEIKDGKSVTPKRTVLFENRKMLVITHEDS